jgi:hypothetical protein
MMLLFKQASESHQAKNKNKIRKHHIKYHWLFAKLRISIITHLKQ